MIGIFDSGLGGLSVLREVRAQLPLHDLIYVADTAYCPYGPRSRDEVRARALAIGRWLRARGCQVILVACNTASSAALDLLRQSLPLPIVGMEPGLKPAAQATRSGRVGVLATCGTLAGDRFATLLQRYSHGIQVLTQPCPGLVERVEAGQLSGPETLAMVQSYLTPLLAAGVDTLVLGCTHYPFLRPVIDQVCGDTVRIIDTGPAVARQLARVCPPASRSVPGQVSYLTSGDASSVAVLVSRLVGERVPVQTVVIEDIRLAGRALPGETLSGAPLP